VPVTQPLAVALIVAGELPVSARPETGKSAKETPAATVTEIGTPTFEASELEMLTVSGEVIGAFKTKR